MFARAAILLALGLAVAVASASPIDGLRPGHPRIILTDDGLDRILKESRSDPLLAELLAVARREADVVLTEPVTSSERDENGHLLIPARDVLRKVTLCALQWRLTGDERFKERAWKELEAAAAWPTWNPSHFLDTAEMTTAFAIGYDWLHSGLTSDQRTILREAIVNRGLREGLDEGTKKNTWWLRSPINWNPVCNAGLVLGAIAVAENEPDLADRIIRQALASVPLTLAQYEPDGAYPEGPAYWGYGTNYLLALIDGLRTGLGSDFGLVEKSGSLPRSAIYRLSMSGPAGLFNYGDGVAWDRAEPALMGISTLFNRPEIVSSARLRLADDLARRLAELAGTAEPDPQRRAEERYRWLQIVWYDGRPAPEVPRPLAAMFRGPAEIAVMRSSWDDPAAAFVGFKLGENSASHAHLDLGSFVFDADGVRWAHDPGPDHYKLPGYFKSPQRWTYFRNGSAAHNTITDDGKNQPADATARITSFRQEPDGVRAVADLSGALGFPASRGLALLGRNLIVQDEVPAPPPGTNLRWAMLTDAKITIAGDRAILEKSGHRLVARILEPPGLEFSIESATPKSPAENPNTGFQSLVVRVPEGKSPVRLTVGLFPDGADAPLPVVPLEKWKDPSNP